MRRTEGTVTGYAKIGITCANSLALTKKRSAAGDQCGCPGEVGDLFYVLDRTRGSHWMVALMLPRRVSRRAV